MTRLADLAHLPRPGDAGEDRLAFFEHPLVRELPWPELVTEQFLYDHGTKPEFIEQYGHIDLEAVRWPLEELPAKAFATVTYFRDWLPGDGSNPDYWIGQRTTAEQTQWAGPGTWIKPPLLIDRSFLAPPGEGLHLVEGHTRLGTLRGRVSTGASSPEQTHEVFVGLPW